MSVSDNRKEIEDLLQQLDAENHGGGSVYNILHDPSISSLFDEMTLPSVPDISDSEEDADIPHIFGMNQQEAAMIDRPIIGGYHDDQELFGIHPTKNNIAATVDNNNNNNNNNEDVENATNDANDEEDDDQWEIERQRAKGEMINPSLTSASNDAPSSSNVESTTDIDTNHLPDGPYASAELSVHDCDDIADGTNAGVMRGGFTVTFGGKDDDDDDDDEEEKSDETEVNTHSEEKKQSLMDDDGGISFSTEDLPYDDTVDLQGNPIQKSYTSATDSPSPNQSIRSSVIDKPRVEIIREYLQNDSSSSSRGCSCQITPNQHLFWQDITSPPAGIPLLSETRPSSLHSHHRLSDVSTSFALSSIASSFIDLSPKQTSNAWNRLIKQPNQSLSSKQEEEVDKQEGGIMEEKTSNTSLNNLSISNEEMMCFMKSLTSSSYNNINDHTRSKDQFVSYHIRDDDQKTMNDHSDDNDDDDEQEDDDQLSDPRQAAIQARITMRSTVPAK